MEMRICLMEVKRVCDGVNTAKLEFLAEGSV